MDRELHHLRELIAQQRDGHSYSADVHERVAVWVTRRRETGAWWSEIACELGLSRRTLKRWCSRERKSPKKTLEKTLALVPVTVVDKRVETVAVVSPRGFRIEGLSFDEAIEALRRIG